MSFINAITGLQKGLTEFLGQDSISSTVARSVITNIDNEFLNKFLSLNNSAEASKTPNPGQAITLNPDANAHIPVVYGETYVSGIVTDAYLTPDNLTMWYCVTLSEKTGNHINGTPSVFSFKEAYYESCRLAFDNTGYNVNLAFDNFGNSTTRFNNIIKIYPFNGNSESPTGFTTEFGSNSTYAYNLFPTWSSTDMMNDLNFVLVKINYSASNGVRDLKNLQFRVSNTLKDSGDVLNDYCTSTRYGAGIRSLDLEVS